MWASSIPSSGNMGTLHDNDKEFREICRWFRRAVASGENERGQYWTAECCVYGNGF